MRKGLLFSTVLLLLAGCNSSSTDTPDAERVIRDTVAQQIFKTLEVPADSKVGRVAVAEEAEVKPTTQSNSIHMLLERLKGEPQKFVIDNRTANEVKAKNGTVVRLAPFSFSDKDGNEVADDITLEVREGYNREALLRENMGTLSANAMQMLEAKGMLSVRAFNKGRELFLKTGERLSVEFPFSAKAMQGYAYYKPAFGSEPCMWEEYKETPADKLMFQQPQFSYNGLGLTEYLREVISYPDYARANELSAKAEANVHINENGEVTAVTANSRYTIFSDGLMATLKKLNGWAPAKYGKRSVASVVKVKVDYNLRRAEQIQVLMDPADVTYLAFNEKPASKNNNAIALFDRTGWICIGREANLAQTKAADIVVPADENTDVMIAEAGRNVFTHAPNFAGYCRSRSFAVNSHVVVMMIKTEGNNIYYARIPLTLKQQNVIEPVWKKTEVNELAAMLQTATKKEV